ncbi:hypothetical protein [uncultured Draconibacterium sp.]|uniref:hypothetical protein n=1 Tax=uncultured Draconibacterium sp. TaxID=1573823 RepID=UPI002AA822E0|nr:hypothetical protein [uncultured Draconibacterium sp.]
MKKQILILTLFVAAILVGNNAFGQVPATPDIDALDAVPTYCTPAVAIDCGNGTDALAPVPGTSYEYTITSPTTTGRVHWFVTDEASLIDAQGNIAATIDPSNGTGNYILTADAAYNDPTQTSKTVNITWKSFDGNNNNVILVVYNVDDANCTDNMEVYRIIPQYSFTLDIASIADNGVDGSFDGTTETPIEDCVNPIQSASYDGTTLTVDYGTDYVFFAVNAANWQTSWLPDNFDVTTDPNGGLGGSTVAVTGWAYPDEAATTGTWHAIGDATDVVEASHYDGVESVNGFVGSNGACIIVRVEVVHGSLDENITDQTINLTVNGEMYNAQTSSYDGTYPDLDDDGAGGCTDDLVSDNADYVLTARPDVDESTPNPFEDKNPNGD